VCEAKARAVIYVRKILTKQKIIFYFLFAVSISEEIRNQKSEIRNQKSEIRNQKSEIRNQKSEIADF